MEELSKSTSHTDHLLQLGFERVGKWIPWVGKSGIKFDLNGLSDERVLYAFVVNGNAKYIGVCEKDTTCLQDRMNRYKSMQGSGQNKPVAELILATLKEGTTVEIWAAAPRPPLAYRGVTVDLVKGLENPLIDRFSPDWNR